MDALSLAAAVGLAGLAAGIVIVNAARTPPVGQFGAIVACIGVLLLAVVAIVKLFG